MTYTQMRIFGRKPNGSYLKNIELTRSHKYTCKKLWEVGSGFENLSKNAVVLGARQLKNQHIDVPSDMSSGCPLSIQDFVTMAPGM